MSACSQETREKISKALRAKWASGTRKKNPRDGEIRGGETRKRMMADGTMRKRVDMTTEKARHYRSMADEDKVTAANRRIAMDRIGVPMTSPLSRKGPGHHRADYWIITNKALGVCLEGLNLNELVRNNSELFPPDSLNWNGRHFCKATKGIQGLFHIRKSTGKPYALSWKGWTPVNKF